MTPDFYAQLYIKFCLKMLISLALSLSRSLYKAHFASNLLLELPFAFTTKVICSAID